MSMDRRTFLTVVTGTGTYVVSSGGLARAEPSPRAKRPAYAGNRSPLQPAAFVRLPPGAVKPRGWLSTQLSREVDGLCGRYPEVSHFLQYDNTGWIHRDRGGWEEVPYWLRGYVDLGYVTGDSGAIDTATRWIEGVLATQQADGFFGPASLRTSLNGHLDPWPHMPMLAALRSYAEYTGDARAETALGAWFAYLNGQPAAVFTDGWGHTRWGDTIDVVYWLYNRTGESFLLDVVRKIHTSSANWVDNLPTLHNVNIAQGFREPAQYWVLSGDSAHRTAAYRNYERVQSAYGQFPGGGFAGDENARPGFADPRQGFETCGVVEYMLSHEILTRITGDPVWCDRTEELAFNSLPAALDPLGRAIHYVTAANSVDLDNAVKTMAQFDNGFAMQSYRPGVDQYRCCPHNYGMGWPYYVEEMWLATPDGGLCAGLFGPSTVTAKVAGGTTVTIVEDTAYPFSDTVTLRVEVEAPTAFPLSVRIPGWCDDPSLVVAGSPVDVGAGPRFARIARTWAPGDTVTLRLPMRPSVRTWPSQHGAASVHAGPLAFSVRLDEEWVRTGGSDQWPEYDVHTTSPWNYGLVPDAPLAVSTGGDLADPFTPTNAPVRITTGVRRIEAWQADWQHVVTPLQDGPIATTSPVEEVTLIPMGAARLRITAFPRTGGDRAWVPQGAAFRLQNRHSGKVLGVDRMSLDNSANVVQYDDNGTEDHLWRFVAAGNGHVKVENVNSGKILAVENMSTADSARIQQFSDSGTRDHLWQLLDNGDGYLRLRNVNSGKVIGIDGMSTANSAQAVQFTDNGTADHDWRILPEGEIKLENLNSRKVLAVENMSTDNSAHVQQYADNGTPDHLWVFVPDAGAQIRIRNGHSGKVLGVDEMSTAEGAQVVQYDDNGTADHLWRIRVTEGGDGRVRIQNVHSRMVFGVEGMSTTDSADIQQFLDNDKADHHWRLR